MAADTTSRVICLTRDEHVESVRRALSTTLPTAEVIGAGSITTTLQHTLNNPLTALLAEAQLLEMDDLSAEQREAVGRIVEMCRRTVDAVRRIDILRTAGD
jgi:signal transduction histidine kinase